LKKESSRNLKRGGLIFSFAASRKRRAARSLRLKRRREKEKGPTPYQPGSREGKKKLVKKRGVGEKGKRIFLLLKKGGR